MFKYMDDYYLEPNQSILDQVNKIDEEYLELRKAWVTKETTSEIVQEALDLILATKNFLKKLEAEDLIDIPSELFKHQVKLNRYLETGKYKK